MNLSSSAFEHNHKMPFKYTCDGMDISPPLAWGGVPEGSKSLALICDDPDAPGRTWVHWVVYNIPAQTSQLPEAVPTVAEMTNGARQGKNDFGRIGYGGACPPQGHGVHRYFFKLYALDTMLVLKETAVDKNSLVKAMQGHVLAETQLIARYKR